DPDLKILIFIVNFINQYFNVIKIYSTIDSLNQYKLIETYVEMLKANVKHIEADSLLEKLSGISKVTKHQILSMASFAETYSLLIEKYAKERGVHFVTKQVSELFRYIIKLFLINYRSEQLHISAKKNLTNQYNKTIEFTLIQCEYLTEIHNLLKIILPAKMDMLVVLINQLLRPLHS
ncbi:MAG: hypothetical protein LBS76_01470, partial [Mycoplasmataceae bacterium]|nr:hypothetical protein [Mycoplasmataceae bacterium]